MTEIAEHSFASQDLGTSYSVCRRPNVESMRQYQGENSRDAANCGSGPLCRLGTVCAFPSASYPARSITGTHGGNIKRALVTTQRCHPACGAELARRCCAATLGGASTTPNGRWISLDHRARSAPTPDPPFCVLPVESVSFLLWCSAWSLRNVLPSDGWVYRTQLPPNN